MTAQPTVKEKPIIFSGPMVRAILENRKSMTRRVIKPQPTGAHCCVLTSDGHALFFKGTTPESPSCDGPIPKCPYHVGQRLWVRETWAIADIYDKDSGNQGQMPFELGQTTRGISIWYKAGGGKAYKASTPGRWRSPIFMPRAASRITLEVTGIRVERVSDISDTDVDAEGTPPIDQHKYPGEYSRWQDYKFLWDSINGKKFPMVSNPWCRVIEFRTITKG